MISMTFICITLLKVTYLNLKRFLLYLIMVQSSYGTLMQNVYRVKKQTYKVMRDTQFVYFKHNFLIYLRILSLAALAYNGIT